MTDFSEPSSVRIFAKSLHWLAAGWTVSIAWLWLAGVNQSLLRRGDWPENFGASTLVAGVVAALAIEAVGLMLVRWTGRAPKAGLEKREWRSAFWWASVPNALLVFTVYVMIEATR